MLVEAQQVGLITVSLILFFTTRYPTYPNGIPGKKTIFATIKMIREAHYGLGKGNTSTNPERISQTEEPG